MIAPRGTPEWEQQENRRIADSVFPLDFHSFDGTKACEQCAAQVYAVDRLAHGLWHEALNEMLAHLTTA